MYSGAVVSNVTWSYITSPSFIYCVTLLLSNVAVFPALSTTFVIVNGTIVPSSNFSIELSSFMSHTYT